jgi:prolyl-tRNA editing enzyme YbaK/EbsC (Cys-tRNA(Pro) deacylase)
MESIAARVQSLPISDVELSLWFYFRSLKLASIQLKRAEPNYYDLSLDQRREFLKAPSTYHLCKTLVMENTDYDESKSSDIYYPKYVAVIIQYESRLNSEKVMKFMKDYQKSHSSTELSRKCFHFRLADESVAKELTGYGYNAITPFLMRSKLPVILSKNILSLTPQYIWLGGGEVDLKLGISIEELISVTSPLVADIIY